MSRTSGTVGFTYLGLLIAMTIIGIMAGVVGPSWSAASRAEKERELIWRGHQFRNAIGMYVRARVIPVSTPERPGMTAVPYPSELKDLQKDPKFAAPHRYLRKSYIDPMTGEDDWVVVLDEHGHIKGVHSNSDAEPLKQDNFDLADSDFAGKTKYSEWIFQYP